MTVVVITPPEPFLDLDLAKLHLRELSNDNDDLIEIYIAAACGNIDGPDGWLGRAIGEQTLRAYFDSFEADLLPLEPGPLLTIASVKYDDADGSEQTVDSDLYTLDPAGVLLVDGETWPTALSRQGSVRVQYTAGYAAVPGPITAGALLMVGDLYANRETSTVGVASAIPMSATVENLLAPYRVLRV
jgi:uncharacterized phiE125 gp8 family phage protein